MSANGGRLRGLVLAGGRSERMGRDKASMLIGDRTMIERAVDLLGRHLAAVSASLRKDQELPPFLRSGEIEVIRDRFENVGPISGILSAFAEDPDSSWLVVAVDMPFLDDETLRFLLEGRDAAKPFTTFRSQYDGLPEPLCAIYEPAARTILLDFLEKRDIRSVRKIMGESDIALLELPNVSALDNVNLPGDYSEAINRFRARGDEHHG